MSTILILNSVSSLLAAVGIGAYLQRKARRLSRERTLRTIYVTTPTRSDPRR